MQSGEPCQIQRSLPPQIQSNPAQHWSLRLQRPQASVRQITNPNKPWISVMNVTDNTRYSGDSTKASVPIVALRSLISARTNVLCNRNASPIPTTSVLIRTAVIDGPTTSQSCAQVQLPADHRRRPAVVSKAPGGGQLSRHQDVGPSHRRRPSSRKAGLSVRTSARPGHRREQESEISARVAMSPRKELASYL